jgi:hypothetical protein
VTSLLETIGVRALDSRRIGPLVIDVSNYSIWKAVPNFNGIVNEASI